MTLVGDPATAAEVVVLLDDDGSAIGTAPKREVHDANTPLHLGFSTYLFDSDGQFVVSWRARHKATFAGVRTNSFCGHPAPGEPLVDAVRRRARVELGVAATDVVDVRLVLPDFAYRAQMNGVVENERCPVLVAYLRPGVEVVPAPDEVDAVERVAWSPFVADVLAGRLAVSPWCTEQVAALAALGEGPGDWPDGDPGRLPPACSFH